MNSSAISHLADHRTVLIALRLICSGSRELRFPSIGQPVTMLRGMIANRRACLGNGARVTTDRTFSADHARTDHVLGLATLIVPLHCVLHGLISSLAYAVGPSMKVAQVVTALLVEQVLPVLHIPMLSIGRIVDVGMDAIWIAFVGYVGHVA
jgi:hypothetical protein